MAQKINRLSPTKVNRAKAGMHPDGGGLYLQVSESRTTEGQLNKSWLFRWADRAPGDHYGKDRQMGLGSLKTYGLVEARAEAARCRRLLDAGEDPIVERDARRAAKRQAAAAASRTFEVASLAYMTNHEAGWRNAVHRKQWGQTLRDHVYPTLAKVPVNEVTTDHVLKILSPIWTTKPETAARVRARIERVLDFEKANKNRSGENPAAWAILKHLLPARSKVRKGGKHPALPWEQIPQFMRELRAMPGIVPHALEFAILTAARAGEVRCMVWAEVVSDVWTVPAGRMKAGIEHRVPLSPRARAILDDMHLVRLGDHVFVGDLGDQAPAESALRAVLRRMNEARGKSRRALWTDPKQGHREVSVHGFRSSFRDWVQEATNFPDWLAEAALAHASGDKVERAYKRGDALAKRRKLMEAWAAYCSGEEDARPSLAAE
jgi:integrase